MKFFLIVLIILLAQPAVARDLPQGVAWLHNLPQEIRSNLACNNDVVAALSGTTLYGLDTKTGEVLWTRPETYANEMREVGGQLLLTNGFDCSVFDFRTGRYLWSRKATHYRLGVDRVWLFREGKLISVDPSSGGVRWKLSTPGLDHFWISPRGVLWATEETVHWQPFEGEGWRFEALVNEAFQTEDGWILNSGKLESKQWALDSTGRPRWTSAIHRPCLAGDVLIGHGGKGMIGLDTRNGNALWTRPEFPEVQGLGPVVRFSKFSSVDVYAEPQTGRDLARISSGQTMHPVLNGNRIGVYTEKGTLVLDATSGQTLSLFAGLPPHGSYSYRVQGGCANDDHTFITADGSVMALGIGPGRSLHHGRTRVRMSFSEAEKALYVHCQFTSQFQLQIKSGERTIESKTYEHRTGYGRRARALDLSQLAPGPYQAKATANGETATLVFEVKI